MKIVDHATLFSHGQGMGYIFDNDTDIKQFIFPTIIKVGTQLLVPNCFTDLDGYLTKKVEYLGTNGVSKEMIFYYGSDNSLFPKFYYGSIFQITETRIFEMFSNKGGRDQNFINGKWK